MSKGKHLSYYKFTPSKWLSGDITLCSYEAKGIFTDLCALFWAREGVLKEAFVEQVLSKCSPSVRQELFDLEIISYVEGLLHINFLIVQLNAFEGTSEKRAEAGRKSAEARKQIKQNLTSVEQNLTSVEQTSTIQRREDKIREKKIREDKTKDIVEILDHLNSVLNTSYKLSTKKNQDVIKARLNEGFTVTDFKIVIDKKLKEWKGTEFEKFLRPETLFSNKFEGYLNQREDKLCTNREQTVEEIARSFRCKTPMPDMPL